MKPNVDLLTEWQKKHTEGPVIFKAYQANMCRCFLFVPLAYAYDKVHLAAKGLEASADTVT